MNTIQSLTHQIERLRRSRSRTSLEGKAYSAMNPSPSMEPAFQVPKASAQKSRQFRSRKLGTPVLILMSVASLTGLMGTRFYNQPRLVVGREAPETIYAPESATIIDTKTTEERRKEALYGGVPILVIQSSVNQDINQLVQATLQQGNVIRRAAGSFPFVDTGILSTDVQQFLRQVPEWYWQRILDSLEQSTAQPLLRLDAQIGEKQPLDPSLGGMQTDILFQKSLSQLYNYSRRSDSTEFQDVITEIGQARKRYAKALAIVSKQLSTEANQGIYDQQLLTWSEKTWSQTEAGVKQVTQQMLSQGIAPGLPEDTLQNAIRIHVQGLIPEPTQEFAVRFLSQILRVNLAEDRDATRKRAELAAQEIQTVEVVVHRGELIVQKGEEITQRDFVLLDYFNKTERGINWYGLLGLSGMITGGTVIVLLVGRHFRPDLRRRDYFLLLLLTLSTPVLILLKIPSTNLPGVGLLVGSFYGSAVGATLVSLLSIFLSVGLEVEMVPLIATSVGGILGGLLAGQLRSREELALLGGSVGVAQGLVYLVLTLIISSTAISVWYVVLGASVLKICEGVIWSIIALGISPYLEHVFDLITPIRLAELANPNRPLLKRLASEAPGTFQHTMCVATLAEAAAQTLGCNVELVRTGTLYHDIGKMHDPMGFIENQMGGPNKHDEIDDPWKSTAIIRKHVTEGLVMARRCRLPKAIQAFIPEHQGRMLIAYFYYQAQQRAKEDPDLVVREEDFRYAGPIPQSRETGIVMLADSCEAALRSLKEATHEEALQMVNKILRARWQDNQLIDSGLTREDMSKIGEVFVRVWEQVNHKRIAYPKSVVCPR
ncbi:MAG: HD family phosphohydrolase [Microcoleaceae cyanobacterium]